MELTHLGFAEEPFRISDNADFLYLDPPRRGALSILITAVSDGTPSILINGGPEVGKTSVMIALAEALAGRRGVRLLRFEQVFQCNENTTLQDVLTACQRPEQCVNVLLLDDADQLTDDVTTSLWAWADEFRKAVAPLTIVMSATPKPVLHDTASKPADLPILVDRVVTLEPLAQSHLREMIQHRLDKAGYTGPEPFSPEAIARIAFYSRGYPGRITRLCSHILNRISDATPLPLTGTAVKEAAWDLFLPESVKCRLRELQFGQCSAAAVEERDNLCRETALPFPKPKSMTVGTGKRIRRDGIQVSTQGSSAEAPFGPLPDLLRADAPVGARKENAWLSKLHAALTGWFARSRRTLAETPLPRPPSMSIDAMTARIRAARASRNQDTPEEAFLPRLPFPAIGGLITRARALLKTTAASASREDLWLQPLSQLPKSVTWTAVGLSVFVGGAIGYLMVGGVDQRSTIGGSDGGRSVASAADLDTAGGLPTARPIIIAGERNTPIGPQPLPRPSKATPTTSGRTDGGTAAIKASLKTPAASATAVASIPEKSTTKPATKSQIETVQKLLTQYGFAPGPIDGIAGRQTRAAIRAFQKQRGLAVDGIASDKLIENLTKQPPKKS